MIRRLIIINSVIFTILTAQLVVPGHYKLAATSSPPDSTFLGLYSNVISDIRLQGDSTIWLGTGQGVSRLHVDSTQVYTYYTSSGLVNNTATDLLPTGGTSALAISGDKIALAAAGKENDISIGRGLALTDSSRNDWLYLDQPTDDVDDTLETWFGNHSFLTLDVTVEEQNVTYDAHIAGDYLWIASWAGGIRRYKLSTGIWDRIPLPLDNQLQLLTCEDTLYTDGLMTDYKLNPRDPYSSGIKNSNPWAYGQHNHKGFAVLAYNDTVWVGTANGINRGIVDTTNDCIDWNHYFFPEHGLSGNWVVSLARQDWNGKRIIWAVTMNVEGQEQRGLSYTTDDGETWHSTLHGERAYNVSAFDSLVFAATDNGLWRSDDGNNWALYKPAKQFLSVSSGDYYLTDEITTNAVYSAFYDINGGSLWIGTGDGLARTDNLNGLNWQIFRTEVAGEYVYPNPFYAGHDGTGSVRFHIDVKKSFVITMDIFNFAMQQVYHQEFDRRDQDMGALKWNGTDNNGRMVANGTYFIRLEFDNADHWFKLIVVK